MSMIFPNPPLAAIGDLIQSTPSRWFVTAIGNGTLSEAYSSVLSPLGVNVSPTYSTATVIQSLPRNINRNAGAGTSFGYGSSANSAIVTSAGNPLAGYFLDMIFGFDANLTGTYSFLAGISTAGSIAVPNFATTANAALAFGIRQGDANWAIWQNPTNAVNWSNIALAAPRSPALTCLRLRIDCDGTTAAVLVEQINSATTKTTLANLNISTNLPTGVNVFPICCGFEPVGGADTSRAALVFCAWGKKYPSAFSG